jgi:hypothetical protein
MIFGHVNIVKTTNMGLQRNLEEITPTSPILLSETEALAAFNLFMLGKSVNQVKHTLYLPTIKLSLLYVRLMEMREMIDRIVKHEAKLVREVGHYDEEGNYVIDTPEELCPVPQSLSMLIQRSLQLISQDYNVSEPLFDTDDISVLMTAITYVITQLVIQTNSTNNASYSWYKDKIVG